MNGKTARYVCNAPQQFVLMESVKSSIVIESSGPTVIMPATLIKTSTPSTGLTTRSTSDSTCSRSRRSQGTAITPPPHCRSSSAATSRSDSSRAQIVNRAPWSTNCRAMTGPSPREPPVTMTRFARQSKLRFVRTMCLATRKARIASNRGGGKFGGDFHDLHNSLSLL